MNLLTTLPWLTLTTIPRTLIVLTLLTPLNILIVTLLTKLKKHHLQYYHYNYITARSTKGSEKNSTMNTTSLLHRRHICVAWSNIIFQKNSVILQKNNKCSRDSSFVLQKVQDGKSTSLNLKRLSFVKMIRFSNLYWNTRNFVSKVTLTAE